MESGDTSLAASNPRQGRRHMQVPSRAKTDAVMRLLKGESLDDLSHELGVSVGRIEKWKNRFVEAGSAELAKRTDTPSANTLTKHWGSIQRWIWLLIALVGVIGTLAVVMQRSSSE
jgi:hypothetical protein